MGTAFTLNRLGIARRRAGRARLGPEWLDEALALRRELGDRRGVGMTLGNLGVLAARAGELERGRSTIGEALTCFEETDDAPGQMGMRLNLGNLAADAGETGTARGLLDESRADGRDAAPAPRPPAGRRSRSPRWRSRTATSSGRDRCSTRRSRACGRSATGWGVARGLELGQAAAKGSLSPPRDG